VPHPGFRGCKPLERGGGWPESEVGAARGQVLVPLGAKPTIQIATGHMTPAVKIPVVACGMYQLHHAQTRAKGRQRYPHTHAALPIERIENVLKIDPWLMGSSFCD
jgi:hypothetical protein